MIKKAVVEIGKTPSVLSGKVSDKIDTKEKEALTKNETLKSDKMAKVAMAKIIDKEK